MGATLWRNLCVVILVREPHDVVVSVVCRNEDACVALPGCGERASGNQAAPAQRHLALYGRMPQIPASRD